MRDLEIRGAGNLLGDRASRGHIAAVGYDLYCQMVTEAVAELKGEPVREPAEVKLDLPVDAHLPATTWPARSCGWRPTGGWPRSPPTPRSTTSAPSGRTATARSRRRPSALLAVARLRAECVRLGIREVGVAAAAWRRLDAAPSLKASEEVRLRRLARDGVYKADLGEVQLPVPRKGDLPSMARRLPARAACRLTSRRSRERPPVGSSAVHPRAQARCSRVAARRGRALVGSACSTVEPERRHRQRRLDRPRPSFNDTLHQFADNPAFIARVSQPARRRSTGNGSDTVVGRLRPPGAAARDRRAGRSTSRTRRRGADGRRPTSRRPLATTSRRSSASRPSTASRSRSRTRWSSRTRRSSRSAPTSPARRSTTQRCRSSSTPTRRSSPRCAPATSS